MITPWGLTKQGDLIGVAVENYSALTKQFVDMKRNLISYAMKKRNTITKNRRLSNLAIFGLLLLMIMMTSLTISALEGSKKILSNSSLLVLKGVSIYGNSTVRETDIFESVGLDVGTDRLNSFMSHIIEKRIKSHSRYVNEVDVKRDLLKGQLIITVEEREPIAIVATSMDTKVFRIVDINGFILDELSNADFPSLYRNIPFIFEDNANANNQEKSLIVSRSANLGLRVLAESKTAIPELLTDISSIDARNSDDIILHLRKGVNIRLASDRIKEGLLDARCLILNSKLHYFDNNINYIDARFPGAIYCG
jgi:hypothetical protein